MANPSSFSADNWCKGVSWLFPYIILIFDFQSKFYLAMTSYVSIAGGEGGLPSVKTALTENVLTEPSIEGCMLL